MPRGKKTKTQSIVKADLKRRSKPRKVLRFVLSASIAVSPVTIAVAADSSKDQSLDDRLRAVHSKLIDDEQTVSSREAKSRPVLAQWKNAVPWDNWNDWRKWSNQFKNWSNVIR